ncbi:MAG: DNA polymerase II [Gammaproteobacteria bacterium]|nr:DNA polymerase II [Gammaproteobacteria bacterium]
MSQPSDKDAPWQKGFILQASYRIERGIPVVVLYGRLEDGATFLVRDRRQAPHFYVRAEDVTKAKPPDWQGATLEFSDKCTFAGQPVQKVIVATPPDTPAVRDRLHQAGIDTFEADVRFAVRYLIDRDVKGGCEIRGARAAGEGCQWVFDEPELRPAHVGILPRVLAFDIETDGKADRLLAISLYGCGADEVYIVDSSERPMPDKAVACRDEKAALEHFCRRVVELDVDVLTGWNVVDFDLSVLSRVAARVRHPLQLGREPGQIRIRPAQGYFGSGSATIPGRLVLDGMDLLRGAFVRMDDYSLDAVAREVLGEGKALAGASHDRLGEILHNYANDLAAFALYARTDARLALEIVERLDLVNLAMARSRLTGMTPDRVAASIASFDFLYLAELGKRDVVAPTVRSDDSRVFAAQAGGHVLEPVTGVHDNVWVFDFKSLYPSIMRTYNVDPLGFVAPDQTTIDAIEMASSARFRRQPAILPSILDALFPQREKAKRAGDGVASQAIKILMNSFYGVLGTPACRFHNPEIANAITGQGRYLLLWSKSWFEERGFRVLYGDTDSLFVASGLNAEDANREGPKLALTLTEELTRHIDQTSGVVSRLELEFEKLYRKLFLPAVRSGTEGARKRYAGIISGQSEVEFVGMEVVRRDWTELAKHVQRELYARLFGEEPVEAYLSGLVREVRGGLHDDWLVYHKGLRKPVTEYTASTPPHVAAARKSKEPAARVVHYLITRAGPEPLDNLTAEPDREHYVEKQVKPVAEPVLATLGLKFAQVIGDDKQLGLF